MQKIIHTYDVFQQRLKAHQRRSPLSGRLLNHILGQIGRTLCAEQASYYK